MSIGYQLVKLFLKLTGEKKSWSQDPIDYKAKRKKDIHNPKKRLLSGLPFQSQPIHGGTITKIAPKTNTSDVLLIYCHGGAFVYGPTEENWKFLVKLVKQTGSKAWMMDYPKAPEYRIDAIAESVYQVYSDALKEYDASKIILIGDSAGGSLIITLCQRLVKENKPLPGRIIPITPIVDASVSNPDIPAVDKIDPILSLNGVLSANKMCVKELSLKDPLISPLYGSLDKLPPTYLFTATDDILTPDQLIFIEKMKNHGNPIHVIEGKGLPHVWPILPVMKEAKEGTNKIVTIVNEVVNG
ncbi:alpha/beta hydrolase [Aquimarina sp. D1M17]|uniref:alpha/beta hydrolase fold domain-containing protein n=1 Tax=Aquimarina acroporae TaxID=2937283 RepID=UPI0020BED753|nr:alpha/beta hydrolase [Aquimarina acroporae]MCK8520057.1 alpha/beta hydrolase [Aquimarina acroporae]